MSHAITYDIFELAKDLKKSKIPDDAIDALIKFEKAKDESLLSNLATKQDLKYEIELVRKDIESINSKTNIILWVIGATGIITTLPQILKLFGH